MDPGACAGGLEEHCEVEIIAREIAHRMRLLEPHVVPRGTLGKKINYVRQWERPGDIAVEIHLNASTNERASGAEVYYCSGSNRGKHLADLLLTRFARIGLPIRGSKPDTKSHVGRRINPRTGRPQGLGWCRRPRSWSVIVECEFITFEPARVYLAKGGGLEIARWLASGLDTWS